MGTRESIDHVLDQCLQELARSGASEDCLRHYPGFADRLRPLLALAQATRRFYAEVPEPPGALAAGRDRMLTAAAQQRHASAAVPAESPRREPSIGRRITLALPLQIITILLTVLLGTVALGGGVVLAARNSIPGDLLYRVKLAAEDVRLGLASDPADEVALALAFIEQRSEEMQKLAASGQSVPDSAVVRMEGHIERALNRAAWSAEEEMLEQLTQIAKRMRAQLRILERVQPIASEPSQVGLARAISAVQRGAEAAEAGLRAPQIFRRRFQHRNREPEPTASPEPGELQFRNQNQERRQENESTPHFIPEGSPTSANPRVTPQGSQKTPGPKITPESAQATIGPHLTPQGSQAPSQSTATHQRPQSTVQASVTPPGPQSTMEFKATPKGLHATPQGSQVSPEPKAPSPGPGGAPGNPGPTSGLGGNGGQQGSGK